jgi:hypothetical protein
MNIPRSTGRIKPPDANGWLVAATLRYGDRRQNAGRLPDNVYKIVFAACPCPCRRKCTNASQWNVNMYASLHELHGRSACRRTGRRTSVIDSSRFLPQSALRFETAQQLEETRYWCGYKELDTTRSSIRPP